MQQRVKTCKQIFFVYCYFIYLMYLCSLFVFTIFSKFIIFHSSATSVWLPFSSVIYMFLVGSFFFSDRNSNACQYPFSIHVYIFPLQKLLRLHHISLHFYLFDQSYMLAHVTSILLKVSVGYIVEQRNLFIIFSDKIWDKYSSLR